MTLQELTLEILAERTLTPFDSKRLVTWAVSVLELGYESADLIILAGLDYDTFEEREAYFLKCIEYLKLDVEKSQGELIEKYALVIANKAIRKEVSIDYAFGQMLKIVSALEYGFKYIAFYEIDEDLDCLKFNNSVIFNSELTIENSRDFILEEFKIFVQMEEIKLPKDERNKCYCETCKKLNIPVTRNKYQLKKPFKYLVWTCGLCGSVKLKFNPNHVVKRMIIEEFKKNRVLHN